MQHFQWLILLTRCVVPTLVLYLLVGCHHAVRLQEEAISPLQHSRQVIVVLTPDWQATTGTLQRYAWNVGTNSWLPVGASVPVSVGHNGLAWARGLHDRTTRKQGPTKQEGDGKSPAGIFALPEVFGYVSKPDYIRMPYRELTDYDYDFAIHDTHSKYYNQIVRLSQVSRDWDDAESMRQPDRRYEWGVVVAQNTPPMERGAGSCIFLHIWHGPEVPTTGGTALARKNMQELVAWLDSTANPILIQLPAAEYQSRMHAWKIPRLTGQ